MKYLGIDYGKKRVGVAVSDENGTIAFPLTVLKNDEKLNDALEDIIEDRSIEEIVIGHSVDKKGKENILQEEINELILNLTFTVGLPIHLEPEWYTTQAATRLQGKNAMKDASAAALILDSYLRKQQ